ncbi:MAG: hypothetical protein ACRCTA_07860, partial [Bacilli bacterium]
ALGVDGFQAGAGVVTSATLLANRHYGTGTIMLGISLLGVKGAINDIKIINVVKYIDVNHEANIFAEALLKSGKLDNLTGPLSDSLIDEIVEATYHNMSSDTILLGKYFVLGGFFEKGKSYVVSALDNNYGYFNTGDEIWNKLSHLGDDEIFRINKAFLKKAISEGKTIQLLNDPNKYLRFEESFYSSELLFLEKNGYRFEEIGGIYYAIK